MRVTHTWTDETARIRVEGLARGVRVLHIADTHVLSERDQREAAYADARASYRKHFADRRRDAGGNAVSTEETFLEIMREAGQLDVDLVVLTGDILHCSAPASAEAMARAVRGTGIPWISATGNHEWWHFEDLPAAAEAGDLRGSTDQGALRRAWWARAAGDSLHPPFACMDVGGIRFVAIDDADHQITGEQLAFAREALTYDGPVVLAMHIPLSLPTLRAPTIEKWKAPILIADPDWDAESRREWGAGPDEAETLAFAELAGTAGSLAAVLCGHIHFAHADRVSRQAMQYAVRPGYEGGRRLLAFEPL